jgi:DNA transformation protein
MQRNEFIEYIIGDQLAALSGMSARAMFGGFGIYQEGTIVGIVVDEELYLKVDAINQAEYEAMGSIPFCYSRKDKKKTTMSYWKVPPEVIEDREKLTALVEQSYEINLKKAVDKESSKKKNAKTRD